jgi:peptide/nickel transport system permease protein
VRFIVRRLMFYAVAFWAALTLNFVLPRLMPGSPLDGLVLRYQDVIRSNPEILQQLKQQLGSADEPIWEAYPKYLGDVLTGDFGLTRQSTAQAVPVSEIIGQTLPWSIFLVGTGFLLAFLVGTIFGMFAAWRRGGFVDNVVTPVLMALQSFPAFFLSLLAVYFLGLKAGWFPIQHAYDNDTTIGFTWHFLSDAFRHAQLPLLVIVAISAGGWLLGMRNVMINTISEEYITMARAKGLRDRRVMTRYAARNAILPPLTGFAAFFASAVGGLILVEYVFSYPGVGLTIQQAALGHDYPLLQALLLLLSFCVLAANLIMDLVYVALDPRVRTA